MYEDIPHLLTPVVVDPKKAANALRWAVHEMEERYKTLAAEGVRNIDQYNRNIRLALEEGAVRRIPRPPAAALHRGRHRRARGPDDGGEQRGRGIDRAAGPDGARGRHPPDPRHAAPVGGRHHGTHQGEPPVAHLVPCCRRRPIRGRFSTATAQSSCSDAATCSFCPRPRRAASASMVHTSPNRSRLAWRASSGSRASRSSTTSITAEDDKSGPDALDFEKDELVRRGGANRRQQRTGLDLLSPAKAPRSGSAARPGSWT